MDWTALLNSRRLFREDADEDPERSPFQRDYDRIVFTTAFRRLQDKTQVFPLSSSDYVRTRLTHSIEVSCVARNLGEVVGRRLRSKTDAKYRVSDIGSIVASAALAHDLGNPPFGHSGEAAIQHWFQKSDVAAQVRNALAEHRRLEFRYYEGNAQAFRLVTRLLSPTNRGGLQLTHATLATLLKYPIRAHKPGPRFKGKVSAKKYNFFDSEREAFEEVVRQTGLVSRSAELNWWCRHPLCFVCEAADDISNRIVDLEDGFRLACIDGDEATDALMDVLTDEKAKAKAGRISDAKERIGYLRAVVIGQLSDEAADAFFENYAAIISGRFEKDLYSCLPSVGKLKPMQDLVEECVYTDERVLGVETAGFEIIYLLLERFAEAALEDLSATKKGRKASTRSRKILGLLPGQYRLADGSAITRKYHLLLAITDFIAGMTDSYAVTTFQRITGQKFHT
jgi:dGTPase